MQELKNVLLEKREQFIACGETVPVFIDFDQNLLVGHCLVRKNGTGMYGDFQFMPGIPAGIYFPAIGFTTSEKLEGGQWRGVLTQVGISSTINQDPEILPIEVGSDGTIGVTELIPVPEGPYLCILDIETGGFSKQKNGLAEIAVIIINQSGEVAGRISWLIKPYPRPVDLQETPGQLVSYKPDAMAVNGLTIEKLEAEGTPAEKVAEGLEYILHDYQIDTIIGHNAKAFDKPWVEYFLERFGTGKKIPHVVDTLLLARENHKGLKGYDLQSLCTHFNIVTTDQHRAGGDTEATRHLFLHLQLSAATA